MNSKIKLSKGILDLKFMKRTKEKVLNEEAEEERQQLYSEQLNNLPTGAEHVLLVPSYYDCSKYLPCRLSFGGFEPETEKINASKLTGIYAPLRLTTKKIDTKMEVDVSVEEMSATLTTNADSQYDGSKKSFKDSKPSMALRFMPKPSKKHFQKTSGSNRWSGHRSQNVKDRKLDHRGDKNKNKVGHFTHGAFGKNKRNVKQKKGVKRSSDKSFSIESDNEFSPKKKCFKKE